jgi:cobalt-zinc-cadmium efflux system membrane fusion protein
MSSRPLGALLRRLGRAAAEGHGRLSDAELLQRFVGRRDEAAFEVLLWRHGPMVLGVCRRLLGHEQDSEDAFQATFLVLARKAATVTHGKTLPGWLHRVACRVALRARAGRRLTHPLSNQDTPAVVPDLPASDLRQVLDEEISRLPGRYRDAFVLCCLEDWTQEEAARRLGCAPGTVASRLAWARERLRQRLGRRGLDPCQALPAMPALSLRLADVTVRAALLPAGAQATPAKTLAQGVLYMMLMSRVKIAGIVFLALALVGTGAGWAMRKAAAEPAAGPVMGEAAAVRLSPALQKRLGIRTAIAQARPVGPRELELSGSLACSPEHLVHVHSRFPGEVLEIGPAAGDKRPLRVGDRVQRNQLLAVLWSKDLAEKKGELLDALLKWQIDETILACYEKARQAGTLPEATILKDRAAAAVTRNAVARAERTLRAWRVSDADIEAIRKAARELSVAADQADRSVEREWARVEIRAPIEGLLVEKNASTGEVTAASTTLFTLADLSELKVVAYAGKEELPVVRALLGAERRTWKVHVPDQPELPALEGSFDKTLGQVADLERGEVLTPMEGHVANPRGLLGPGRSVRVIIPLPPVPVEVRVPAAALVEQDGAAYVFVQPDPAEPVFQRRRVLVLRRDADVVHVRAEPTTEQRRRGLEVLRPGERVVVAGAAELQAALDDHKEHPDP